MSDTTQRCEEGTATAPDVVDELVDGWRTLSGWSAEPWRRPGHRTWNHLVARLATLEEQALADPDAQAALEEIAGGDDDPFVRREARRALDPGVPDDGPARERWARHPAIGLSDVALRWRPGLLLTPAVSPYDDGQVDDSRLFGAPAGPLDTWPRRPADGLPLVLLLDVNLAAPAEFGDLGIDDLLGLPFSGRLQVFHDLESWGTDPADRAAGAWLVRHVPDPTRTVPFPDDLDDGSRHPAVDVRLRPFTAVAPKGPTTPGTATTFERAERRLVDAVQRRAAMHGPGTVERLGPPSDADLDRDPSIGRLPRLLGLPQLPPAEARDLLHAVRPDVRDWQLLAALPGVGPFAGLFGDLGHLEIWCPATDLASGRLDTAWCLIRS